MHRECYEQPARLIALFDCRNSRGSAGDLHSLAHNSAKYSASEWRDIGYGTPCGFCFIFTNDAECLRPAVIAPHSYCGPEMYFGFVGCWFDDLRARPSPIPVSKFALGRCHRRAVTAMQQRHSTITRRQLMRHRPRQERPLLS